MAASIYDVAKRAGVSISTVSRILNHSAAVNEKKAAAVREAMEYYHYEPNQFARGLVKQTTRMIGVYVPLTAGSAFDSACNLEILKGIEMVLAQNNYSMVLIRESEEEEMCTAAKAKFQEYIAQKRIDGLLLGGLRESSIAKEAYQHILKEQYPVVYIGKRFHEEGYHVYTQYEDNMFRIVQTLYEYGHRQIILYYFAAHKNYIDQAVKRAGQELPEMVIHRLCSPDYRNILRLQLVIGVKKYVMDRGCTAICSPGIEFTHTLLSACRELKLSVPEDVSVLTVEHRDGEGELIYPPLSAFHIPAKNMGIGAAKMLLSMIANEPPERMTKEYKALFIERESIRKIRS